jgi:GT2 family glycosyltransferase
VTATIVIVSKNRRDDLRTAIASSLKQSMRAEVIVIDDGSSDGTARMVRTEFPGATVIRNDQSTGCITGRNQAARIATGDVVFSIDDDAEFVSARTVEQTMADFADARVGAVAVPCLEPKKGNTPFQTAPDREGVWITDCFVGTSHAVRRDIFLNLGGYRQDLVHQGEERDYCIRMLQAGYLVRLGRADVIHHYESPKRDMRRMDYYGRRNDVLFAWHYAPMPVLPVHLIGTAINGLRSAWRAGRYGQMLRGTLAGFSECPGRFGERVPVSRGLYRLHRRLKRSGPRRIEDVVSELRAVQAN